MAVTGCGLGFGGGCGGGRGCGAAVRRTWNQGSRIEVKTREREAGGRGNRGHGGDGGLERRGGCAELPPVIHSWVLIPPNTPILSGLEPRGQRSLSPGSVCDLQVLIVNLGW